MLTILSLFLAHIFLKNQYKNNIYIVMSKYYFGKSEKQFFIGIELLSRN